MRTTPGKMRLAGLPASVEGYHYEFPHPEPSARTLTERAREIAGMALALLYLHRCTHVGARPLTLGKPRVVNRGQIEVGDHVVIRSRFSRTELISCTGGRLVIGAAVVIEHGALLIASRLVEIGDRARIGAYCVVADGGSPDATSGSDDASPVWIGDDVILGARVTVLPGVRVGAGSEIIAGSFVSRDVPAGVVAGGNPARPLRHVTTRDGAPPGRCPDAVGLPGAAQESGR